MKVNAAKYHPLVEIKGGGLCSRSRINVIKVTREENWSNNRSSEINLWAGETGPSAVTGDTQGEWRREGAAGVDKC